MSANCNFEVSNDYQPAGVRFNVSLKSGGNGRATFSVTVDDLSSGKQYRFQPPRPVRPSTISCGATPAG